MADLDVTQPDRPVHGGIKPADLRAMGLRPEDVLDFSASISPIGPPRGIWQAMERVELAAYPDPHCMVLKEALAGHLSRKADSEQTVDPEQLLVGNGSTEIIHLLARAFFPSRTGNVGGSALILAPTYGEYQGACSLQGAAVSTLDAGPPPDFPWDLDLAARLIESQQPRLVFLCNPNNPTGSYLEQRDIEILANAAHRAGALLVLDEAYVSFVEHRWDSLTLSNRDDVVILRSMTKDYALTGLRLGYMLSSADNVARVKARQYSWSVNAAAQAAGVMCLGRQDHLEKGREAVRIGKAYLEDSLVSLGLRCRVGAANFLLVSADPPWRAATVRHRLLEEHGICVRDCGSFGMPNYIRIGVRNMDDCRRLVAAMNRVLADG